MQLNESSNQNNTMGILFFITNVRNAFFSWKLLLSVPEVLCWNERYCLFFLFCYSQVKTFLKAKNWTILTSYRWSSRKILFTCLMHCGYKFCQISVSITHMVSVCKLHTTASGFNPVFLYNEILAIYLQFSYNILLWHFAQPIFNFRDH